LSSEAYASCSNRSAEILPLSISVVKQPCFLVYSLQNYDVFILLTLWGTWFVAAAVQSVAELLQGLYAAETQW